MSEANILNNPKYLPILLHCILHKGILTYGGCLCLSLVALNANFAQHMVGGGCGRVERGGRVGFRVDGFLDPREDTRPPEPAHIHTYVTSPFSPDSDSNVPGDFSISPWRLLCQLLRSRSPTNPLTVRGRIFKRIS